MCLTTISWSLTEIERQKSGLDLVVIKNLIGINLSYKIIGQVLHFPNEKSAKLKLTSL